MKTQTKLGWVLALLLSSSAAAFAQAQTPTAVPPQEAAQERYVPPETAVAIVPVVNLSGVNWKELKDKQTARGNAYLRDEFLRRGFKIVPAEQVVQAMADSKIDLTDEEQHRRATFYELGKQLNADLIVVTIITDTYQNRGPGRVDGIAKLQIWLLDVKREIAYVSGKTVEGKSTATVFFGFEKGSDEQIKAVSNGIQDALSEFFSKNLQMGK